MEDSSQIEESIGELETIIAGKRELIKQLQDEIQSMERKIQDLSARLEKAHNIHTSAVPPAPQASSNQKMETNNDDTGAIKSTEIESISSQPEELANKSDLPGYKRKVIPSPKRVEEYYPDLNQPKDEGSEIATEAGKTTTPEPKEREPDAELDDLLAASKLAENIYNLLESEMSIKLRILAMRMGVNVTSAREALDKLEEVGVVRSEGDETNQIITFVG